MTVAYEITDWEEWGKTNPLKYEHNGLKAITIGVGDAFKRLDDAEGIIERCLDACAVFPTELRREMEAFMAGENKPDLPRQSAASHVHQ